ncbi:MAG: prephenate dehydratase domain-containing protein [Sedimentibacter sp.]|uniref:prephenate dehydratase n=1 Tax=Sedimentibacter sp. TaxID=1960295 RepID=UPI00315963BD
MEYDYLLGTIERCDAQINKLFQKRMAAAEELTRINNRMESIDETTGRQPAEDESRYEMETRFFQAMVKSLENKHRYRILPETSNIYEKNANLDKSDVKIVCYQGLPCSYSESAAKSLFKDAELTNRETFEDVFKAVYQGEAHMGIVPIENSTAGYINDVYDLLLRYDLFINHTYVKKVDHCLAGIQETDLSSIREVCSHPQALAQCREFTKNSGYAEVTEINTAVAAQKTAMMNRKDLACICSEEAAEHYGLKILRTHINHKEQNYTRFAAVSRRMAVEEDHNKVSIVFNVSHETGTLSEVLSTFAYYGCNLSYINSRPNLIKPWEYMFYLDFEGNLANRHIQSMLTQLKTELPYMKVLGSFKA